MAFAGSEALFGRLDALADDVEPAKWWIDNVACEIGREPGVHVLVPREVVSRHHARIERGVAGHVLRDLGSANGTFVNGQLLAAPVVLEDCDEIGCGTPELVLRFREFEPDEVPSARPRFDEASNRFMLGGQPLALTSDETLLLRLLWSRYQEVCDRASCATAIWGADHPASLERTALDGVVNGLRPKVRRINPRGNPILARENGFMLTDVAGG